MHFLTSCSVTDSNFFILGLLCYRWLSSSCNNGSYLHPSFSLFYWLFAFVFSLGWFSLLVLSFAFFFLMVGFMSLIFISTVFLLLVLIHCWTTREGGRVNQQWTPLPIPSPFIGHLLEGHDEPAPTRAPWRMNEKWSGNSFLLGPSSLHNHDG